MPSEKRVLLEGVGVRNVASLDGYRSRRGYKALERALTTMKPEEVTAEVLKSNLRGRGGAGFPTGRKWTFVPKNTGKKIYLACNADESEPGTFKDRQIMEQVPHLLIEGCLLACYAIGAETAYIYVRGEYPQSIAALETAIAEARTAGLVGKNILGSNFSCDVWVHGGAGAYICGEETGLLSSLEGGRGYPRIKPPFPAVEGLWKSPTIINNVESLAAVVPVLLDGADAWLALGTADTPGTRLYGVSGHVERPGWFEFETSVTLCQVLDAAGGVWKGRKLKALIPGGSSVPVLRADEIDVACDFGSVQKAGSLMGSAGLIVMDETTCMVDALLNLMEFYHHESCGQCTPCREGTGWLEKLVRRIWSGNGKPGDVDLLDSVAETIGGAAAGKTICFLADSAVMPTRSFVKKFRGDFEKAVAEGGSPVYRKYHGAGRASASGGVAAGAHHA